MIVHAFTHTMLVGRQDHALEHGERLAVLVEDLQRLQAYVAE